MMRKCKTTLLIVSSFLPVRRSPSQAILRREPLSFSTLSSIGSAWSQGRVQGTELFPGHRHHSFLSLMGVYDTYGYFRTPGDLPYEGALPGNDSVIAPYASRLTIRSALELAQGLIWNERDQCDKAEFFLSLEIALLNMTRVTGGYWAPLLCTFMFHF